MFLRAPLLFALTAFFAFPATSQVLSPQATMTRGGVLGTVSGTVRTADNKPAADARIELRTLSTGSSVASGYTNAEGRFELQNIATGSYEIEVDSGLNQVRDRVTVQNDLATVSLRLPGFSHEDGGGSTVSVGQLKVPDKAREEDKKARQALEKKDIASAAKHVEKALQIAPQYAAALTTRALLELDGDKTGAAVADLEKAVKDDAGYGLSFLVLGAAYNQLQHFDDAIRALDHGVALMPNYWQGYFELGKAYLGKNDLTHAQEQIDQCAKRAPADYAPLHLVRANLDLALKNYPAAMTELEAFLDREPNGANSMQARQTLGQVKAFLAKK